MSGFGHGFRAWKLNDLPRFNRLALGRASLAVRHSGAVFLRPSLGSDGLGLLDALETFPRRSVERSALVPDKLDLPLVRLAVVGIAAAPSVRQLNHAQGTDFALRRGYRVLVDAVFDEVLFGDNQRAVVGAGVLEPFEDDAGDDLMPSPCERPPCVAVDTAS